MGILEAGRQEGRRAAMPGLEPLAPGRTRVGSVVLLYLFRLRRRWFAELLAVLAVAAGVALVHAAAVASTSHSASVRSLSDSVVGHSELQLIARGGTRVPQRLYDRIAALAGVRWVAPVLQVPGNVIGRRGERDVTFFGADPRTITLSGSLLDGFSGSEAARQEAVVLPIPVARATGVAFGDDARVQMAGRTLTLPMIVAGREQIAALVDTPIAMTPLRYLQRLARTGPALSRMLIGTDPGRAAEVRAAAQRLAGTRADVFPADRESHLFAAAARPMDWAVRAFAVLAGLVGAVLAACALGVGATDRRRMALQQWTQGVGPSARRATLLVDALAVGTLGTALGLLLGESLSRAGTFSDVSILSGAFPVDDRRTVTAASVVLAAAAGLMAAGVGVLAPLRRGASGPGGRSGPLPASDEDGVEATGGAAGERPGPFSAGGATVGGRRGVRGVGRAAGRRGWLPGGAVVAVGGAVVLLLFAPSAVEGGVLLLVVSLVLVVCPVVRVVVEGVGVVSRRLGQPSNAVVLAVRHLAVSRRRPGVPAVVVSVAIVVLGASALRGGEHDLQVGLDRAVGVAGATDVWVAPAGAGSALGTTPFDPRAAAMVARMPEVSRVVAYRSSFLDVAGRRAWVVGQPASVDPVPAAEVVDGDAAAVAGRIRRGGWATLSADLARALRVGVGERVVLPTPVPVRVRVAATTTNLGWASGAIVLGAEDYARAWPGGTVSALRVALAPGVTPRAGRDAIARTLAAHHATWLRAQTGAQRAAHQRSVARAGPARLRQVALLTLLAGLLALAATVIAVLWQHRAHVARLRADGPSAAQIRGALLVEVAVLLTTGAVLGALHGLLGQVALAAGVKATTSFPVVVAARPGIAAVIAGAAVAAGLAVAALFAWGLVALTRPAWRR